MKKTGLPRRNLLVEMCPSGPHPIVDVGADHGHVASKLGCVATERMPGRMGRTDIRWVISDGLTAFRSVGVAIIAGMGARTIMGILDNGPRPEKVLLHAQDDPNLLRLYLSEHGWRIKYEGLAPEARAFAQVILAEDGIETAKGLELEYGPTLLRSSDPYLESHLVERIRHLKRIAQATKHSSAAVFNDTSARIQFLQTQLAACFDRKQTTRQLSKAPR